MGQHLSKQVKKNPRSIYTLVLLEYLKYWQVFLYPFFYIYQQELCQNVEGNDDDDDVMAVGESCSR